MAAKKPQEMQYYETLEGTTYLTYLFRDLKCTDEEASKRLGISRQTLHTWKNKSKIIQEAINVGKACADTLVENKLLKSALAGNVTAMIFWLVNRKPKSWQHVQKVDSKVEVAENITFEFKRGKK